MQRCDLILIAKCNQTRFCGLSQQRGGRSRVDEDDYIDGVPELIVEVAVSSASYDLREKMQVYRRNGVQEYIVWQVSEERLDWFHWQDGHYVPLVPDAAGMLCSRVFPGLWLDVTALTTGNLTRLLAAVRQGVATADHAALVRHLSQRKNSCS